MNRAVAVLVAVSLFAATGASAAPARPDFEKEFPEKHAKRLLERVSEAPPPYRRLLRATYPRTKIRVSDEVINGSYVENERRGGENHYVVYLDLKTRRGGAYGDHLTTHELGHVIANDWFDEADYQRFFDLFRQSPRWRDCFETDSPDIRCVPDTEILADQLAFYATGNLNARSPYNVPPLADRPSMTATILASD